MRFHQAGLDVSQYAGHIDWERVAWEGKQFVILCALSPGGGQMLCEDTRFGENLRGAQAAGLRVGAYYSTCAVDTVGADRELALLRQTLRGCKLQYPVFVHAEHDALRLLGRTEATRLVQYALEQLCGAGYCAGLYTGTDFALDCLCMDALRAYPLFLADDSSYVAYDGPCDLRQYTDAGVVQGVEERVNLDVAFTDFLPRIRAQGLNHYRAEKSFVPAWPLRGFSLVVYGARGCPYFSSAVSRTPVGALEAGRYPATAQAKRCGRGGSRVQITVRGVRCWAVLRADCCSLTRP